MNNLNTIKSSKEIDYIFKHGKKISLSSLNYIIYEDKNNLIKGNVAFIAGKKNGNAVWRNKSKRKLREIYRNLDIKENIKVLMVANKKILDENFEKIIKESKNLLIK